MTKREVCLDGGAPWGFRMNGGADSGHPLRISRVNPGSKAAQQGVREGDVISVINGTPTRLLSNGESHALLRTAGPTLTLGLNQDSTGSPKRRSREAIKRGDSGSGTLETKLQNDYFSQSQIKIVADSSACTSSSQPNKQGKKIKQRKQESIESGKPNSKECNTDGGDVNFVTEKHQTQTSIEISQKMSSSRARRLRKARLKNKIKEGPADVSPSETSNTKNQGTKKPSESLQTIEAAVCKIDSVNVNGDNNFPSCNVYNNQFIDIGPSSSNNKSGDEISTNASKSKKEKRNNKNGNKLRESIDRVTSSNVLTTERKDPKKSSAPHENSSSNRNVKNEDIIEKEIKSESVPSTESKSTATKVANECRTGTSKTAGSVPTCTKETVKIIDNSQVSSKNKLVDNNKISENTCELSDTRKKTCSNRSKHMVNKTVTDDRSVIDISLPCDKEVSEIFEHSEVGDKICKGKNSCKKEIVKIVEISCSRVKCHREDNQYKENENLNSFSTENVNITIVEEVGNAINESVTKRNEKKEVTFDTIKNGDDFSLTASEEPQELKKSVDKDKNPVTVVTKEGSTNKINSETVNSSPVLIESVNSNNVKMIENKEPDLESSDQPSIEVFINPPTPTMGVESTFSGPDWENVEEMETSSGPVSSDEDVHQEYLVHFPPNDLRAQLTSPLLVDEGIDEYGLTIQDIRSPLIPPEEEERLRCFLETLDLTKPEEYDDSSSNKSSEESGVANNESECYAAKQEIVVYKHCKRRCVAEPCYIPSPHRYYLDVITEENSDLSDSDKKNEERPWEDPDIIRKNNEFDAIPDDWIDSDNDLEDGYDDGGIKSWSEGTTLDEAEGVEIVYLDSDNSDDTVVKELEFNEKPQLVVVQTKEINQLLSLEASEKDNVVKKNNEIKNENDDPIFTKISSSDRNKDNNVETHVKPSNSDNMFAPIDRYSQNSDRDIDYKNNNSDCNRSKNNEISDIKINIVNSSGSNNNPTGIHSPSKQETDSVEITSELRNLDLIKNSNNSTPINFEAEIEEVSEFESLFNALISSSKPILSKEMSVDQNTRNRLSGMMEEKCPVPQQKLDVSVTPVLSRQNSSGSGTPNTQSTTRCTTSQSPAYSEKEDKIGSVFRELEFKNPESLKELSTKRVISLPNGIRLLEEVGIIRFRYDTSECDNDSVYYKDNCFSPRNVSRRSSTLPESPAETHPTSRPLSIGSSSLPNDLFSPRSSSVLMLTPPSSNINSPPYSIPFDNDEHWLSMQTSDENVRVCLSPSQSKSRTLPASPKEAAGLLDLHKKFVQRRGYHEDRRTFSNESLPSPDLIQLEHCNEMGKRQDYTPELLTEAANLLALKEYRQSRFNENKPSRNSSDKFYNNFNQTLDELSAINQVKNNEVIDPQKEKSDTEVTCSNLRMSYRCSINGRGNESKRKGRIFDGDFTCKTPDSSEIFSVKGGESEVKESSKTVELDRVLETSDGSRLLALIQSQKYLAAKAHCPIATTALFNPLYDRSGEETVKKHTSSGDFVSGWLTMSRNVTQTEGERVFDADQYRISKQGDIAVMLSPDGTKRPERPRSLPPNVSSGGEIFRKKMYDEYMDKLAERIERRQQKVIKISDRPTSMFVLNDDLKDVALPTEVPKLEDEFMCKLKERMNKLGISLEDEDTKEIENEEQLPKHLQEFVQLTSESPKNGVWSPVQTPEAQRKTFDFTSVQQEREKEKAEEEKKKEVDGETPVVWTPRTLPSPPVEKKTFRPINFESPPPVRKNYEPVKEEAPKPPKSLPITPSDWSNKDKLDKTLVSESIETHRRLTSSQSAESSLAANTESSLPRAPNPTITLLQKAREGQLPRGAHYLEEEEYLEEKRSFQIPEEKRLVEPNEIIYTVRREYNKETEDKRPKKIVELGPRKFEGIGPTTKEGIPIVLRSEVKDTNQQKWYKRMYDSLHRAEKDREYLTVRYKPNRRGYPYTSGGGYLSEPDRIDYDSDAATSKYATLDRRRIRNKENDFTTSTMPRSKYVSNSVRNAVDVYKNQPGRIEDYEPGRSSISEKEAKQWWDEVLDIFDEQFEQSQKASRPPPTTPNTGKPFMTYALKESGYESDSQLVFKRRDENLQNQLAMSPSEQKMAYKVIQKGGEVPLHGLRKPAPERPKDETELEYFPISPHLTRIRIHRTKKNIKPVREIICYPVTSIKTDNPPPVFSTFKRTARPSISLSHSRSPDIQRPPSPPKRQSSKSNSALRLYSKMSVSPYPRGTHLSRHSSGLEAESNVKYLTERITNKLGGKLDTVENSKRKGTPSSTSRSTNFIPSRKQSPSPGVRKTSNLSKVGSGTYTKKAATERKFGVGSLRSRREQAISSKLNLTSDLRAPAEVRKVLREREAKEKSLIDKKGYPPGTVVKSTTTLYSSAKNSKKPKEDKSLKVTVAISAKGRELLRASSLSSGSVKENGILSPKRVGTPTKKSETGSKSPSPSSLKTSASIIKSKTPIKVEKTISQNIRKRTASPTTSKGLKQSLNKMASKTDLCSEETIQMKKSKKSDSSSDTSKKKKDKNGSSNSKPLTIIKNLTTKKNVSDKIIKESNGKKKSKKKSENNGTENVNGKKVSKKSTSKSKSQEKEDSQKRKRESGSDYSPSVKPIETDSVETGPHELKVDPITDSKAIQPLKSDTFFQHLFLRNTASSPTPSNASSLCYSSSVLERAKRFCGEDKHRLSFKSEPSLKLLNVYLNHRKPVTESKFRSLDREIASGRSSRSLSPYYTRGRSIEFFERIDKFDRMNNVWDQSVCSMFSPSISRGRSPIYESTKERSSSEPPRSSPTADIHSDINQPHWDYTGEVSPSLSRSPSCRRIRNARTLTKTIESIGGLKKKGIRAKSVGEADRKPLSILQSQSTSSLNLSHVTDHSEYQSYIIELLHSTKKSPRFRELHKFYSSLERMGELERTTSNSELRPRLKGEEVIDYDRWKQLRTKERAEEELKFLYEKLKEDQKERGLLFRPREPEAFRWRKDLDRGLRNKEKSVEDLKNQFHRLSSEESDLGYYKKRDLDSNKDFYKPLWRGSSVVNLASSLTSTIESRRGRPVLSKDHDLSSVPRQSSSKSCRSIGSRLWSSLSMDQVNALKHQLSEIYSTVSNLKRERINRMIRGKDEKTSKEDYEISVPPKESSLSGSSDALHVRCNSLLSSEQLYSPHVRRKEAKRSEVMKADSISSIPQLRESKSVSSGDSQTSTIVKPLSENEKRRLSMSLSQEILDRVSKRREDKKKKKRSTASLVIPRETLGAVAAVKGSRKLPIKRSPAPSDTNSPRTCYSIEMSEEGSGEQHASSTSSAQRGKHDFLLVLTPNDNDNQDVKKVVDEWATTKQPSKFSSKEEQFVAKLVQTSNSETDSGSSEASTVIHLGSRENVQKRTVNAVVVKEPYPHKDKSRKSRSDGDVSFCEKNLTQRARSAPGVFDGEDKIENPSKHHHLTLSQSFTDLKELFGEKRATLYATSDRPTHRVVQVTDLDEDIEPRTEIRPASPVPHGSDENTCIRSRSVSPDPMKYYRAYLNMVKAGDVRKLRERFESLDDIYHAQEELLESSPPPPPVPPKKFQSDPDLTRDFLARKNVDTGRTVVKGQEFGDVKWLKKKYEIDSKYRSKQKSRRVVSPLPFRAEDRFMPHINVISKMASLQQQKRSSTAPPRTDVAYRTGEVDRIRQNFEEKEHDVSLMGQMYTSTPDVRELHDIAPYLECEWVAHQHSKPRSLSSPEAPRSIAPSPRPRPSSSSPIRRHASSILKHQQCRNQHDIFANQQFDPSIHQPLFRYQPPVRATDPVLHYRPWKADPNWWWRHMYTSAKPTVTFQEPISGGAIPVPERDFNSKQQRPESPHRYVESEVTIHYRSPVRSEAKEAWSEEELARRQAEAMRRIYQEERRRKYLQELQDMYSRRHTDNFIPSQKSPIPLNRYDDFFDDVSHTKPRDHTPEPKLVARALYNFVGQSSRELTFRRGDVIFVRRQIDKNWYEGEHNAMIGLFPINYVEIIPYDGIRTTPKRPSEGQARAKFNFQAQTHLELSLVKGELVVLTRRVDDNWFEGRIGSRKGIFPVSYVDVLVEPGERAVSPVRPTTPASSKPVASPAAHSLMLNGAKNSLSHHHYTPPPPVSYTSLTRSNKTIKSDLAPVNEALHIDTQSEPVPYRALYNYKPQNDDELELNEGDTVYVMEKCDDGWYVGSSQRTGCFGTFPGNYVQRLSRGH